MKQALAASLALAAPVGAVKMDGQVWEKMLSQNKKLNIQKEEPG